jgi:hypothetical protein
MKDSKKDLNKITIKIPFLGFKKTITRKFWDYCLKMGIIKKCGLIPEKYDKTK